MLDSALWTSNATSVNTPSLKNFQIYQHKLTPHRNHFQSFVFQSVGPTAPNSYSPFKLKVLGMIFSIGGNCFCDSSFIMRISVTFRTNKNRKWRVHLFWCNTIPHPISFLVHIDWIESVAGYDQCWSRTVDYMSNFKLRRGLITIIVDGCFAKDISLYCELLVFRRHLKGFNVQLEPFWAAKVVLSALSQNSANVAESSSFEDLIELCTIK